jgi:tRNA pseudouridine55 synthase
VIIASPERRNAVKAAVENGFHKERMDFITGEIIGIDKPLGWTSFDAVKRVRGAIQRRLHLKKFKVGHAGTLDPLATGVLIVCTGRATKRIDELQNGDKEYVATIRLGATTPSFDLETEVDAVYPWEHITRERVEEIIPTFIGKIMQVPPVFSAVKVDGKRAYNLARKGKEVELKAKSLYIKEMELLGMDMPEITLRIVCSKGTYIRALARDLGEALGSGAHLTGLRRTRVGDVRVEDCLTIADAIETIGTTPLTYPEEWKKEDIINRQTEESGEEQENA